jgi:D-3-phosphoglycerate dehydrogenase
MKPNVFLVNTSRGSIINQSDLYDALANGKLSGIALDVMEKEPPEKKDILKMDNVVYTPHVSWHSEESEITLRKRAAQEVLRVLMGGQPINLINKEILSNLQKY